MRFEGYFGFGQQGYTVHWDKPKTNGTGPAGEQKDNDATDEGECKTNNLWQSESPRRFHS
jgi:hypothetical protein